MVLAGVVSVAAAIAAFFVGVLVVFVAAIVFTVAIVAALAITVGLLVVVLAVAAVLVVGPMLAFLGAMVFLASAVLALAHRRPRVAPTRSARSRLGRMRWPRVGFRRRRAATPRPHRPLTPAGVVGVRRVDAALGHGLPLRSRVHREPLEREGASEVELEHV
ncbi:MAG TPA: hypothetical protein VFT81_01515 [Dermatophilaceae bacterium]|nr:hypothetical protein [Dermatophilaceae bacterium]